MRKILLSLAMLTFIGMNGVNGQSELIITEDFQTWEMTYTDNDTCSKGNETEYNPEGREMSIKTKDGFKRIPVKLTMVVIMPECDSRRIDDSGGENLPGVTTGWVQLNKLTDEFNKLYNWEESADTIGEFIFGPIPQIDSIVFAHSATGSKRGARVYKSTDGETWENASPDNEFWDCADCQSGTVNTVVIDESEVWIKFTSGFKESDSTSQYTRLHNIDVYGVPGTLTVNSIAANTTDDLINIYPVPAKDFVVVELAEEPVNSKLQIIDVVGKSVYSSIVDQQTSNIDISQLNSGMYFIQITHNGEMHVKQLMVE